MWGGNSQSYSKADAVRELARGNGKRQVFATDMVAHVWAAQSQDSARSNNGNVYFDRRSTLYSYGTHFPLGVIMAASGDSAAIERARNAVTPSALAQARREAAGLVFLNADSYSPTTSAHQSSAFSATRHMTQYKLPALGDARKILESVIDGHDLNLPYTSERNPKTGLYEKRSLAQSAVAFLESNATAFEASAETGAYWRKANEADALAFGAVCGLKPSQVTAALAKGRKAADQRKAEEKETEQRRDYREAVNVAAMSDSDFRDWRSHFVSESRSVQTDYAEKQAKAFASRLRRMIKLLRGEPPHKGADSFGYGTRWTRKRADSAVMILKARLAMHVTWAEGIQARAVAAYRKETADKIRSFRRQWREAKASGSQAAMVATADQARNLGFVGAVAPGDTSARGRWIKRRVIATVAPFREAVIAERHALAKAEAERRLAERQLDERNRLNTWLAGGVAIPPRARADGTAYIRRRGEMLQTSQGADVPWTHAVKAFRFMRLCRERGESFASNGRTIRVGHFQVDSIDSQGNMRAGCHNFAWEEAERLAKAEGVWEEATPSAEAVESSH